MLEIFLVIHHPKNNLKLYIHGLHLGECGAVILPHPRGSRYAHP